MTMTITKQSNGNALIPVRFVSAKQAKRNF